jgi:hypothetical protein
MKLTKTLLIMIQLSLFESIITNTNPKNQSFLERGLNIRTASLQGDDPIEDLTNKIQHIVEVDDRFINAFVQFILNRINNEKDKKQIRQRKKPLFESHLKMDLYEFVNMVINNLRNILYYGKYSILDKSFKQDINVASLINALIYIDRFISKGNIMTDTNKYM